MRVCIQCEAKITETGWDCPICGWSPQKQENFPLLSPYLASGFPDYPIDAHDKRVNIEENSFWFLCRNDIITNTLRKAFPKARNLLEIGCGTGIVLSGISKIFPDIMLFGAEAYPSALIHAKKRVKKAELAQIDAYRLPFIEEFDVVCAFDVLEHLEDDILALKNLFMSTKSNGGIIITVPQHPWLWSVVDEKAGHKRRYNSIDLNNKIQSVGFEVLFQTSFITLLLPMMMVSRWKKSKQYAYRMNDVRNELNLSKPLNKIFRYICSLEVHWLQKGFSLPIGGSLLCVARKKKI